jgi:hypothetical protein
MHHTNATAAISERKIEMKITADAPGDKSEVKMTINGNDAGTELQKLVDALKADKMDDKGNLSVELKNGEFIINGKKQPDEILKKYKQYLDGKKELNFSINIQDK